MTPSQIAVRVRLLGQRAFQRASNATQRSIRAIADTARRANTQVAGLNAQLNVFGTLQKLVAPFAMIAALGVLAQLVVTVGGGFIALAGAMAPALGLMMAYPGAILAVVQGMMVLKFATSGLMDAVGGLDEAMDPEKFAKLPPAMQGLAKDLDALKPRFRELRADTASAIAPGLRGGLHEAVAGLSALYPYIVRTATVLGDLGYAAGLAFRQLSANGTLGTVMSTNILVFRRLGIVAIYAASGFMYLMRAARPMFNVLSDGARRMSRDFLLWSKANQQNGNLTDFFEKAMLAGSRLWRIGRNLVIVLWNIASAGAPLGDQILVDLVNLTREWVRWTRSVEGKGELKRFFAEVKPNLYALASLAAAVGAAFVRIGRTPGLAKMASSIETKLLPVLEELFGAVAKSLTPAVVDFISNMGGLVSVITGVVSPMTVLFTILSKIAYGFTWLINTVPGLKYALGGLLTAMLLLKAGMIAFNIVQKAMIFLFNMTPIGRVVFLVTALAVALVAAYKKSETFRNIVDSVWAVLKKLGMFLFTVWLTQVKATFTAVKTVFMALKTVMVFNAKLIGKALSGIWDVFKSAGKGAINFVITILNTFINTFNGTIGQLSRLPGVPDLHIPNIPKLAAGGIVSGAGSFISGEAGAELVSSDGNGNLRVAPLSTGRSKVTKANVGGGMLDEGALADLLTLWVDLTANLDGSAVARSVSKHAKKSAARQGRAFAGA